MEVWEKAYREYRAAADRRHRPTAAEKQLFALYDLMKEPESSEMEAPSRLFALLDLTESSEPPAACDERLRRAFRELMEQLKCPEAVAASPSVALFQLAVTLRAGADEDEDEVAREAARELISSYLGPVMTLEQRLVRMRLEEQGLASWPGVWKNHKRILENNKLLRNRSKVVLDESEKILNADAENAALEFAIAERETEFQRERVAKERQSPTPSVPVDQADTCQDVSAQRDEDGFFPMSACVKALSLVGMLLAGVCLHARMGH